MGCCGRRLARPLRSTRRALISAFVAQPERLPITYRHRASPCQACGMPSTGANLGGSVPEYRVVATLAHLYSGLTADQFACPASGSKADTSPNSSSIARLPPIPHPDSRIRDTRWQWHEPAHRLPQNAAARDKPPVRAVDLRHSVIGLLFQIRSDLYAIPGPGSGPIDQFITVLRVMLFSPHRSRRTSSHEPAGASWKKVWSNPSRQEPSRNRTSAAKRRRMRLGPPRLAVSGRACNPSSIAAKGVGLDMAAFKLLNPSMRSSRSPSSKSRRACRERP